MNTSVKGILLAGGSGTRLHPLTQAVNKHLLAVYDKPMIYYPLTALMLAGVRDITLISTPDALPQFRQVLGDGSRWGLTLTYRPQARPEGIAQAFRIAEEDIAGHRVALMLGDNILYGSGLPKQMRLAAERVEGATIFAYRVANPERFGVVTLDRAGQPLELVEKPQNPVSHWAVPGLYFYDQKVLEIAAALKPSARGELEITDVNRVYLERGQLRVELMGRGCAWLDSGTAESLFEATQFVRVFEERTGLKIASPEEVAYRMGYIALDQLRELARAQSKSSYGAYLAQLAQAEGEFNPAL
ncbi:glucose-1-phosphate thymidylyltransferase [Magnetospirillum fulvum]|uniref:Glucose-1-phosphate thymidylyltransferase n=2 Tax=Magnetospirillum fulvum TaxID=1082 RepID=A0A1H6H3B3_MAGFU|nr:glucose-1-phosphate thymidylyltransferase [Magnetospirillum fulvum]